MSTPPANRACALLLVTVACVGPAGPDGEPGADGAAGPDGARSLTRLDAEPPGAQCALGGARLATGIDDDGDGQLDPDEVDTTAYLCHGASDDAPRGVLQGTFHVRNQRDVDLLALVEEITGELIIERAVPDVIVLGALRRLGGTLRVAAGSNLVTLEVPALVDAGGIHIPDDNRMTRFRAPALTTAGAVSVGFGTADLDLTALTTAAQLRLVAPLDDLQILRGLVHVTGDFVFWSGGIGPVSHWLRSCAGLERLESVGTLEIGIIDPDAPCTLPSLADVAGSLRIFEVQGSYSFPALVHAGQIELISGRGPLDVALDALQATDRLQVTGVPGLRSLRAPALVGSEALVIAVGGSQLTELALPSLRSVQDLFIRESALVDLTGIAALEVVASALFLRDNARLVSASLPALRAVRGSVLVYNNPLLTTLSAPSLDAMGFSLAILDNPQLCASQAQAIIDHLRALGWMGAADTRGLRAGC
jgi:hypothetical protein